MEPLSRKMGRPCRSLLPTHVPCWERKAAPQLALRLSENLSECLSGTRRVNPSWMGLHMQKLIHTHKGPLCCYPPRFMQGETELPRAPVACQGTEQGFGAESMSRFQRLSAWRRGSGQAGLQRSRDYVLSSGGPPALKMGLYGEAVEVRLPRGGVGGVEGAPLHSSPLHPQGHLSYSSLICVVGKSPDWAFSLGC